MEAGCVIPPVTDWKIAAANQNQADHANTKGESD